MLNWLIFTLLCGVLGGVIAILMIAIFIPYHAAYVPQLLGLVCGALSVSLGMACGNLYLLWKEY